MQRPFYARTPFRIATFSVGIVIVIVLSIVLYGHVTRQPSIIRSSTSNRPISLVPINCATPPHNPGDSDVTIHSGGLARTFIMHLPPSYGTQPQPLIIVYHAYSMSSALMEHYTDMDAEADKAAFIVVYPQGVDQPSSWDAGNGAYGPTGDANDIQFTRDMLSYLEHTYCVDAHHVYAAGYSLGGGMAYRIACTLTSQFAAIATVSGAYYPISGGCHPSRPIPILEFHGQADQFAPYNGNPAALMAPVQSYLSEWLNLDRCSSEAQTFFQQGDVTGMRWDHCASGTSVVHYRISDGGHTWPGASPSKTLGYTTHIIDANVVIWNFFSQYHV
jgi:polyhydroxybutyrate depolymerase